MLLGILIIPPVTLNLFQGDVGIVALPRM